MGKSTWVILTIIVALVILVVLFWDKLIIREEEIISIDYCEADDDCVWAVNPYLCCLFPSPLNHDAVEVDNRLVLYEEGVNYLYDYPKDEQCFSEEGGLISGCVNLNIANYSKPLKCIENKCTYNN